MPHASGETEESVPPGSTSTRNRGFTALTAVARVSNLGIPAMVAVYAAAAAFGCVLALQSQARFVDLHVYRLGGHAVLHGELLYNVRFAGTLRFTYPPFAAIVFTPVAALPWTLVAALVLLAGVVALPVTLYLALRLPPASSWLDRRAALRLSLAAAAVANWLEPVRTTLSYGQINLLIALLVLYDLCRTRASWLHGAGIGLAAGIKLTPAIFAVYLLATRRYRAAAVACIVFAGTVALGFAVTPASSAQYWDKTFLTTSDVGRIQNVANQSLLGALARTLHAVNIQPLWLPAAMMIGLAGMLLAVRAGRAGDEARGFSLCAVTGLLISPISWSHHWVIAVPALLLAAVATWRRRSAALPGAALPGAAAGRANAMLAAIAGLTVICMARVVRHVPAGGSGQNAWLHLNAFRQLTGDIYVLAGLAALAVAAWPVIRPRLSVRPGAGD